MADVWRDERFVQHERGILEACVEVAIRPFVRRFAHRQTAVLGFGEVRLGPLEFRDRGLAAWRGRPDVTVRSRVRPTGPQRIEGIHHERKPLEINSNSFDCFGGGQFIDRGHGENRLALVHRLHSEPPLAPLAGLDYRPVVGEGVGWRGKIVRRENRSHTGHRQRFARIDALYPGMRQRAE